MASSDTGGTSLVFSIEIGSETTYGLIQDLSIQPSTERAEARGPAGDVYAVQEYNDLYQMSMTYLEKAAPTGAPVLGTLFEVNVSSMVAALTGTTSWYVNDIDVGDTVDGFRSITVNATHYPNLDATP